MEHQINKLWFDSKQKKDEKLQVKKSDPYYYEPNSTKAELLKKIKDKEK